MSIIAIGIMYAFAARRHKIARFCSRYMSDFFERNRSLYYDNLMRVEEKNDLLQWFKFFLVGIIETAKSGITTFDNIFKLQKK